MMASVMSSRSPGYRGRGGLRHRNNAGDRGENGDGERGREGEAGDAGEEQDHERYTFTRDYFRRFSRSSKDGGAPSG